MDPRIGLRSGQYDAAEAVSNLRVTAKAQPPRGFEQSKPRPLRLSTKRRLGSANPTPA